jgi:putative phosphoribosyl transferase
MIFANRRQAGLSLSWRLQQYADRDDVIVLGVPRGGVPVAFEVAQALDAPLDIFLIRKLGVPGYEEFAFGAIASGGVRVLDMEILRALGISKQGFEAITAKEQKELRRREYLYRGDRKPLCVSGLTVILVDDGVATGASLLAGIRALRQLRPAKIVVAVPVAAPSARERLAPEVDDFVCVAEPDEFRAVGQFYDDFSQVEDGEVMSLLSRSRAADSRKVA